jgi:hypothetical protein
MFKSFNTVLVDLRLHKAIFYVHNHLRLTLQATGYCLCILVFTMYACINMLADQLWGEFLYSLNDSQLWLPTVPVFWSDVSYPLTAWDANILVFSLAGPLGIF